MESPGKRQRNVLIDWTFIQGILLSLHFVPEYLKMHFPNMYRNEKVSSDTGKILVNKTPEATQLVNSITEQSFDPEVRFPKR